MITKVSGNLLDLAKVVEHLGIASFAALPDADTHVYPPAGPPEAAGILDHQSGSARPQIGVPQ